MQFHSTHSGARRFRYIHKLEGDDPTGWCCARNRPAILPGAPQDRDARPSSEDHGPVPEHGHDGSSAGNSQDTVATLPWPTPGGGHDGGAPGGTSGPPLLCNRLATGPQVEWSTLAQWTGNRQDFIAAVQASFPREFVLQYGRIQDFASRFFSDEDVSYYPGTNQVDGGSGDAGEDLPGIGSFQLPGAVSDWQMEWFVSEMCGCGLED